MARERRVDMIREYAPQYVKFAEPDGVCHGAYGDRIATNARCGDQLNVVLHILRQHIDSRQAIVTCWDADKDLEHAVEVDVNDMPCTLGWQFSERLGTIRMTCFMRSNDVWLGFPNDIFVNSLVQWYVAHQLGMVPGRYVHLVGSMHLYDKDQVSAIRAIAVATEDRTHNWKSFGDIQAALDLEAMLREGRFQRASQLAKTTEWELLGDVLRDVVICVSRRWLRDAWFPQSLSLCEAIRCLSSTEQI
jgi:thymidylate synthase